MEDIETNIRGYGLIPEPVIIAEIKGRLVIRAFNEGGYNCTDVDLLDVIDWVKQNKPELLK